MSAGCNQVLPTPSASGPLLDIWLPPADAICRKTPVWWKAPLTLHAEGLDLLSNGPPSFRIRTRDLAPFGVSCERTVGCPRDVILRGDVVADPPQESGR